MEKFLVLLMLRNFKHFTNSLKQTKQNHSPACLLTQHFTKLSLYTAASFVGLFSRDIAKRLHVICLFKAKWCTDSVHFMFK